MKVGHMTINMVTEVSSVHLQAFKGAMNTRLGRTYVRKFLEWFVQREGNIALVAMKTEGNEQIVGYVLGAPLGYGKTMNRDLFWVAGWNILIRPWLLLSDQFRSTIKARIVAVFNPPQDQFMEFDLPAPVMSLVGLAVMPNQQGQNIGKELLLAFEKQARNLHIGSLRLSVYPENSAARHAYEKCAWVPSESPVSPGKAMIYYKTLKRR